jgi:hypothetical protein
MIREVILQPAGEVSAWATGGGQVSRDPGTSGYASQNVPSMTLAQVWSDDAEDTNAYLHPHKDTGGVGTHVASFEAPPTLAIYRKVTIRSWWDYAQSGVKDNWVLPPTNSFGPRARLVLRNRAGSGYLYSSYHELTGQELIDHNRRFPTANPAYTGGYLQEWEMSAHPEGGPWTIDDLSVAKLGAGIEMSASSPAFTLSTGAGFFKIRCLKLQILLEVEDLGGFVANVRHAASLTARLMRRARNTIAVRSFADKAIGTVGSRVYLSHPRGPSVGTDGWGQRRLERRAGMVLKRTIHPESFRVEDEVFDLQAYRCLVWAAYRIDGPWSPELQGLAFVDKGEGWLHSRAQDGWSPRPGDGALMRVLEDYPNLSFHGLAAQGGDDVSICLRNYDLMQSGWSTVANTGDFTATTDTTAMLVEEQGYLSSALLAYGAGGGTGGRSRSLGTMDYNAGDYFHVRVIVKNSSVPVPASQFLEVSLARSGGGLPATEFWDEANRQWTTSGVNNPIPSTAPFGEVIFDAIPMDAPSATSDPTYTINVGRFSSSITSCAFNAAFVDVQKGGATWGDSYGCRTPLVTLDAEITREPDSHRLTNTTAAEIWSYTRGVAVVEARPFWRAEVIPTDEVKPLLHAEHDIDTWDAIQFVAKTGSDDVIRFERAVSGEATFQLDCPIPSLSINRTHVLRAWARWLGADGWTEYAPYSVEVGYAVFLASDGSLVSTGSIIGTLSYTGNVTDRNWVGIGEDGTGRYADAYVRLIEVRRNPISGLEAVWRI